MPFNPVPGSIVGVVVGEVIVVVGAVVVGLAVVGTAVVVAVKHLNFIGIKIFI